MITLQTQCSICTTSPSEIILPLELKGRILYCTCPLCFKKVGADIFEGNITCPACGAQAEWKDERA